MDIGEPEIATCIAKGELLVIDTHEVKHGRVQVVNACRMIDGFES